jgi:hypothetical protein
MLAAACHGQMARDTLKFWEQTEELIAMTIEIHTPELEALIMQRMKSGGFHNVEEVLLQALKASPPIVEQGGRTAEPRTGADLIGALQASPHRELDIEPETRSSRGQAAPLSVEERLRAFDELMTGFESPATLPEEAFQRENWYPDR